MKSKSMFSYILALTAIMSSIAGCTMETEQAELEQAVMVDRATEIHLQPLSAQTSCGLTLVEKEFTIEELKSMDISCVKVNSQNESITYTRGGDTLKLNYYQMSEGEYSLTTPHYGGKIYLDLLRTTQAGANEPQRTIQITLPANYEFFRLYAGTASGTILFQNCNSTKFYANSDSGDISFADCIADQVFTIETHSGNITVTNLSSGGSGNPFEAYVKAESGKVQFQTADSTDNYHYVFGTRPTNKITVNGQSYNGGAFEINHSTSKTVNFESGYYYDGDEENGRKGQGTAEFIISNKP